MTRIGILVVHGIGEQTHFKYPEEVASHFLRAAQKKDPGAFIQIRRGDQIPLYSQTESWQEPSVVVSWRPDPKAPDNWVEARFCEVLWADLDMPMTWGNWLKLVGWALAMPGVRLRKTSGVWKMRENQMVLPDGPKGLEARLVRPKLFYTSVLFLLLLLTVGVAYGLARRLSFRAELIGKLWLLIYNYLGDVKLYQDQFCREDDVVETLGEKSRVSIRRRMVRALVSLAKAVEAPEGEEQHLDGYYVLAHSLGTVVAFNALMELDAVLPNYLTKEEWRDLPAALQSTLKKELTEEERKTQQPRRPFWLKPTDAVNRTRLFSGLRGLVTMGSPLDKFATLWPIIVGMNKEPLRQGGPAIPWINLYDPQDIVGGALNFFKPGNTQRSVGGEGLGLLDLEWADQWTLATAHTSYWHEQSGRDTFIDRLVSWVESGRANVFDQPLPGRRDPTTAKRILLGTLVLLAPLLAYVAAWLVNWLAWLLHLIPLLAPLMQRLIDVDILYLAAAILGGSVAIVAGCSVARNWIEKGMKL